MRRVRFIVSFALLVAGLVVPLGALTSPALADSCDHSNHHSLYRGAVVIRNRDNGSMSYWNKSGPGIWHGRIDFGYSLSYAIDRHWEVGADAGFDWKIIRADVNGKYGESYTHGVSVSSNVSLQVDVPRRHTGWIRALTYQRVVYWKAWTERWNANRQRCERHTIAKAYWGDKQLQMVRVVKAGHVFPS